MRVGILNASLAICRLSNLSLLPEWLNGSLPSRATPANRAAQRRAPGVDTIALSQGISIFETPTGVCERHSCESQAHEMHRIRRNQAARRNDPPAASVTLPGSIATSTRSGSARAAEQLLLDAAFATFACEAMLSTLLDILPDVLAGIERSSGPVMNSVASRCARRGASGDHDQTKPLTPQPPFKTSRADLQLRRAAGTRTPLIPARERPSRWPGFGQHG